MSAVRRVWRWVRLHPIVVFVVVFSGLNIAGWRALEAERHDRCVDSRMDIQAVFVAVAEDLRADDETRGQVAETVARVLPTGEC